MGTRENGATAKDATPTRSPESTTLLRADAPQLRTAEAIIAKHEQIQDALERQAITGKVAEQMNQTLKGIVGIEKLGLQYLSLIVKLGKRAAVPRTPILRNLIGLPEAVSADDGDTVRALLPEK
jgi:hypothetical protein